MGLLVETESEAETESESENEDRLVRPLCPRSHERGSVSVAGAESQLFRDSGNMPLRKQERRRPESASLTTENRPRSEDRVQSTVGPARFSAR